MAEVLTLTEQNFESEVLQSPVPVLVDFSAEWCGPCKRQGPICQELAQELGDKAKVGQLDIDQAMDLAGKYAVMSIPTLILFRQGEEGERFVGLTSKEKLMEVIQEELDAL